MSSTRLVLLALSASTLLACGDVHTVTVDHYLGHTYGIDGAPLGRLVVTDEDGERFGYGDRIEGFDFEWGVVQVLRVERRDVAHPLEDASSVETTLLEVVSRTPVPADTRFAWRLLPHAGGWTTVDGGWAFLGRTVIAADEDVADRLETLLAEAPVANLAMEMGYSGDPAQDPLVVFEVESP